MVPPCVVGVENRCWNRVWSVTMAFRAHLRKEHEGVGTLDQAGIS